MIKLIAALTACMALVACQTDKTVPALPEHMFLGHIGCIGLGTTLKGVVVTANQITDMYLIVISCGAGDVRIHVDLPINPPVVKELSAPLKGSV